MKIHWQFKKKSSSPEPLGQFQTWHKSSLGEGYTCIRLFKWRPPPFSKGRLLQNSENSTYEIWSYLENLKNYLSLTNETMEEIQVNHQRTRISNMLVVHKPCAILRRSCAIHPWYVRIGDIKIIHIWYMRGRSVEHSWIYVCQKIFACFSQNHAHMRKIYVRITC